MLLRWDRSAYLRAYQKARQLFNPRRAPGAPWVESADRWSPTSVTRHAL